jgi:LAS superfamily LD-carboxypeptidase LdcB
MTLSRRGLLKLGAVALPPLLGAWTPVALEPDLAALRTLVRNGLQRDAAGAVISVFGLEPEVATDVLLRATRADALPDGYAPDDLVVAARQGIPQSGGQTLRALIVDDTRALIDAATDDGVNLYVGSGYRSQTYQSAVFAAQVQRWGDADTANRYSAQPGHSQHQLGTTIDFTISFAAFRVSPAPDWLRDNAHHFGFLLPYTAASVPLTGYVDEPWHARWVGAELAGRLQALGYQAWPTLSADDVVALIRAEAGLDA